MEQGFSKSATMQGIVKDATMEQGFSKSATMQGIVKEDLVLQEIFYGPWLVVAVFL